MHRHCIILLLLTLLGCKSKEYVPFPQVTYNKEGEVKLYWFTPEQVPPAHAEEIGDFEYVASTRAESEEALRSIGAEALSKDANLVYIERYTRPTTPPHDYIFAIKGKYLQADPDTVSKILTYRQLALDTCQCAYIYVFRNQYGVGDNYVPIHLMINDEPIGGISNQKGYKFQAWQGEELILKSSVPGAYLKLDSVRGYKYIHAFSESPRVYTAPPYVAIRTKNPKHYVEILDFHGRLLAESLYLKRY